MTEKGRRALIIFVGIILPLILLVLDIVLWGANVSTIIPLITWIGFFVLLTQPFQD